MAKLLETLPATATADLQVDGVSQPVTAALREFKSGKKGYFWQGKVHGASGETFQCQLVITAVKSEGR